MRHGLLLEQASRQAIFREPLHPYTRSLLAAVPTMRTDLARPLAMVGPGLPRWPGPARPKGVERENERSSDPDGAEIPLREAAPGHWVRVRETRSARIPSNS